MPGILAAQPAASLKAHQPIPILMQHCWPCHGESAREALLDLRTLDAMRRGGRSGPAIVPGQPNDSLLIRRVQAGECPPSRRLVEANVKPVSPTSLAKLTEWIADGAPDEPPLRDLAGTPEDPLLKAKDRDFWSFRPPEKIVPPALVEARLARNPIDAFLLEKLNERGLSFATEAPRQVLLRRAFFDLVGLPPTPEEAAAFLEDSSPDAYEKLVDRLLASPRYGERWGRHWLDVAGYADVEGKREQHLPRPFAYRYRDYVIRSFNVDKPYDQFLREQIAGDELADYESAAEITPEIYDNLVATAFLRMGPDPTWANITGFIPDRLDVIGDAMDVLGGGVLGLTMKCARCHDHKFDPIPQRDYFRLTDVFKGVLDEYNWLKPDLRPYGGAGNSGSLKERTLPFVTTAERNAWNGEIERFERQLDEERRSLSGEEEKIRVRFREAELAKMNEADREQARQWLATATDQLSSAQKELGKKLESQLKPDRARLKEFDAGFKQRCDALAAREGKRPPEPRVAALWDRGAPSPTYIYLRGDYQRPGARVAAGVPAVLADPSAPYVVTPPWPGSLKTGRRLAFATWLTRPNHPLTSRVLVNRVWKHHFGRGLVRTLDNFGRTGAPPTNQKLLDWLAGEFVEGHWRMKSLHRLLLTSNAYRQSSRATAEALRVDPDNSLHSRMPLQRVDAEVLWDACISVAGAREDSASGPAIPVEARRDGSIAPGRSGDGWRRSIYSQQTRKEIPTLWEAFDLPPMNPNCVQRSESNVATQALHLMNDPLLRDLAGRFARRVEREGGGVREGRISRAFQIAFARRPTAGELKEAVQLLASCAASSETGSTEAKAASAVDPEMQGLVTLCRMLMNSAEFIYVD